MDYVTKRTESFVFYLNEDDRSSTPDPVLPCLLPGEQEICSPCTRVIFYPSFSDQRQGLIGTLHCTTLRLVFVPIIEANHHVVPFPTSKIFCNFRYEIALFNIHSVSYTTGSDTKKYKPLTSCLQHADQVTLVKIFCKDFRVFTLDFNAGAQGYKMLLNCLIKYAFPSKLEDAVRSAMVYPANEESNSWPSFDKLPDWDLQLKRLNVPKSLWRTTHLNECYRHIESYPQFFVVPTFLPDKEIVDASGIFCQRRIPVWCWSSVDGCAIVRSARWDTVSEVMEKHWLHFEHAIRVAHPKQQIPVAFDVNVSLKDIVVASELLRKLCSIESPVPFWDTDRQWNTELEQTGWMSLILKCLIMTEKVVTHIVDESKSVIIRESTNSDVACIVSCLAQLCLDKYFRSFEGFHILLQKEWIALAHPFGLRLAGLSRTESRRLDEEMAPVFVLFLDCVHQLCVQFPSEFEFSEYYLVALWDLALTGLTKTFLFNSLKDCSTLYAARLRHAWSTSAFYKLDYTKLFRNPIYAFSNGLRPLHENTSNVSSSTKILRTTTCAASLDLWHCCYLRWSAPSQVFRGGNIRSYVETLDVCADIAELLKETLFVDVTATNEEQSRKNRTLRRYGVSPLNLDVGTSDSMTSAFPYNFETVPLRDFLYTMPVRTEMQVQNNTGTRSMLDLTTASDLNADVRRLSVARLAMDSDHHNDHHHQKHQNNRSNRVTQIKPIEMNEMWTPKDYNKTRYTLKSVSSPRMNEMRNVVNEMQNDVRFRLLKPQQQSPGTPPLALPEDDFCNTTV